MRNITNLPAWERLLKRIVWKQIGDLKDKYILDFGSGEGASADHFAKENKVVAIEPWEEMLKYAWKDNEYRQIVGDVKALSEFPDNTFDAIICHNVLEYIDDKEEIVKELARVLKPEGFISIVKHNRNGRVMQMAVLLDDFEKANDLLDGKNSAASKFGCGGILSVQKIVGLFKVIKKNRHLHHSSVSVVFYDRDKSFGF